jgi:hypothetical protein
MREELVRTIAERENRMDKDNHPPFLCIKSIVLN